jgi:hypothetical protein
MTSADCQNSGIKEKRLGLHSADFSKVAMKGKNLATKIYANRLNTFCNCESQASARLVLFPQRGQADVETK